MWSYGGVLLLLAAGLLSPIIRAKSWIAIFVLCLLLTNNSFSQMRIRYGFDYLQLEIGQQVDVPISIYVSDGGTYDIGCFCLPLGCNDDYFLSVDDFVPSSATNDWDEIGGYNRQLDHPENNWTTLSAIGWFSLGGDPDTPIILTPSNSEEIVGFMRMTVRGDIITPGIYPDVFRQSSDTYQEEANVGDTMGNMYTVVSESFGSPIQFVPLQICVSDAPYVGTGYGSQNNYHFHIDTYCLAGTTYALKDISRRQGYNGGMGSDESIKTYHYGTNQPYTNYYNNWIGLSGGDAVDAHVYAGRTYDFMYQNHPGHYSFLRNGFDNEGREWLTYMNEPTCPDEAFYENDRVFFGIVQALPHSLAGFPNVVVHEWAHGITDHESGLEYRNESGALNEAFSNMTAGYYNYIKGNLPWWQLGKDFYGSGDHMDDLNNPHLHNDPGAYLIDPYWEDLSNCIPDYSNDYCYVHTNCTVPELMFYLLAEGGQNPYLGQIPGLRDVTVTGIGIENAMMIMYIANCDKWHNYYDFIDARNSTIFVAYQNENTFGEWSIPVTQAWLAVNVYDFEDCNYIPGDCDDDGDPGTLADYDLIDKYVHGQPLPCDPLECEIRDQDSSIYIMAALDVNGNCGIDMTDWHYYSKFVCAQHGRDDAMSFKWCQLFPPYIDASLFSNRFFKKKQIK